MEMVYLAFILILSVFLGFELIQKVPATLHTPLMSGANAISGITLVGALIGAGGEGSPLTIYLVTDRMLAMFKKKGARK
jgi:NAD(P) transhydrogenase subunit alpha